MRGKLKQVAKWLSAQVGVLPGQVYPLQPWSHGPLEEVESAAKWLLLRGRGLGWHRRLSRKKPGEDTRPGAVVLSQTCLVALGRSWPLSLLQCCTEPEVRLSCPVLPRRLAIRRDEVFIFMGLHTLEKPLGPSPLPPPSPQGWVPHEREVTLRGRQMHGMGLGEPRAGAKV